MSSFLDCIKDCFATLSHKHTLLVSQARLCLVLIGWQLIRLLFSFFLAFDTLRFQLDFSLVFCRKKKCFICM